jgi:hypothetical protein
MVTNVSAIARTDALLDVKNLYFHPRCPHTMPVANVFMMAEDGSTTDSMFRFYPRSSIKIINGVAQREHSHCTVFTHPGDQRTGESALLSLPFSFCDFS